MGKFIMDRYDRDIESRVGLASAINALKESVDRVENGHH
jgi:hypothetical protein